MPGSYRSRHRWVRCDGRHQHNLRLLDSYRISSLRGQLLLQETLLTKDKEIIEIVDGPHRLLNTAVTPIEPYAVEIPYEPLEGISHREQMVTLMATAFGVYSIDWLRKKIASDPDDEPAA